ncbi:hypothetical protein EHR04_02330 [Leptospira levettii]|uniref:hypothetical protein n=1 Tax=Leptospira levettii TaxID=2023178 RepID=UPI0010928E15|nr:hypothetical protein [Leptospira levettii]TGM78617.1 hypothetical protein EHR04_02330 [Leptospira levettii]
MNAREETNESLKLLHFRNMMTMAELSISIKRFEINYINFNDFVISLTTPNNRFLRLNLTDELAEDLFTFENISLKIAKISNVCNKSIKVENPNLNYFSVLDLQMLIEKLLIFHEITIQNLIQYNFVLNQSVDY